MMKTRLLLIAIILVFSLGLVTAALAAASTTQIVVIATGNNPPPVTSKPAPISNSLHLEAQAGVFPPGTSRLTPQRPETLGDWDSIAINFPRVIQEGAQYRMWYDGRGNNGWAMGMAESDDGNVWTKSASNPVLTPGAEGTWDENYRGQSAILKDGSEYRMWFSGGPNTGSWQTGYATSTNGIDWNIFGGNPVLSSGSPGSWDEFETAGPAVIEDGGLYKMWYHGCANAYTSCALGYATSSDGVIWTKYSGNPIITGTVGDYDAILVRPSVVKNGSTYSMWYTELDNNFNYSGIGLATSTDGIHWTKDPRNPVLKTGWDNATVSGINVVLDGTTYKMWLRSGQGASFGIGFATSADGVDWTMYDGNPVLQPGAAGLQITVNYAHDWVNAHTLPNVPITISVAGKNWTTGMTNGNGDFGTWDSSWNDPKGPDIAPGDIVTSTAAGLTTEVNPVGTISGKLDLDADTISGDIQAPFGTEELTVRCEVWVENGPPAIEVQDVPANGGTYACDFGAEGWDILPNQDVAVMYFEPDGDSVVNIFHSPWMRVNYAHDWAGGDYPAGHTFWITVTNGIGEVKATTQADSKTGGGWNGDGFETKNPWSPGQPDIQEGDWVYFASDDGYTNGVHIGVITGTVDGPNDSVSGNMYADWLASPLYVECHPWGSPGPAPVKSSSAGANGESPYFCQWEPNTEWDIQSGQDVAVMYVEPDGDRVINVFQQPDLNLHLRVNYGHDWVESFYEGGHTVWITVTQSDQVSVVATAHGVTGQLPWWGPDQTGFSTNPDGNVPWDSGTQPDIKAGDWVYGRMDNGYSSAVHLGVISGTIDLNADSITGSLDIPWFNQTLDIECFPWGAPGPAPNKSSTAGANGDPPYFCQWDPNTEWNILAGQDVGVAYIGPDGNWVANAFRVPVPHLWINTWADGSPGQGGNFAFNVQYQNDGQALAGDTVITDTFFGGMTYISDSSGLPHTGTGAPGDPLVWDIGDLPNSSNNTQFQVFVAVTAPASNFITNTVQIETGTPYSQGDANIKQSQWSGQVQETDARVNVSKGAWTWDPVPGTDFVYNINVCNKGNTGSTELTLTDTLPLSTTLITWWGQNPGWSEVTSGPHLLVVSRPSIPGNWCGEVYARVHLDTGAWSGMPLSNTATIAASNDLDPENNQATIWHNAGDPHNNLSINKDWIWGRLVPGGEIGYELSYRNNGNVPVDGVLITSTLPAHTTFIDSWYNDPYGQHFVTPMTVVPGQYVVWNIGKLDNGYDGRLTIHLGINHTAGPGLLLTHKVAITTLPVEDDFDDNAITWVESLNNPGPNLRVDKQNFDWWGDSTINYELRIYNLGSDTLENFWITDTYPVSTTFEGDWNVNHGGWYTLTVDEANHQLIFWGERLDPGNTASIGFRVNLDKSISGVKGLAFTNRVAAPITGDVFPADNFDEVTALTGPDLYVDKSLAGGDLLPGEIITYKLKFGNAHHGNAKWWSLQGTAWLTDTLPDKAEFLSAKLLYCGSEIWCDFTPPSVNGNNLLWQLWPIGWGGHNEILVTARISDSVTGLDTLLNQVEIASDQPENDLEADYTNNHASLSLPITLPYFETGKSYTSSKVAGMPITYNLTVSNTGSVAGTNVALWDWIPSWMTYGGGGSYDAGLITWTLPTIGPGSQASAWFTGTLQCTEGAIVNNQYYFVESSDQGVTSTYGAPVSFATLAPTIDVTAQASKTTIRPGQTVYFTATATTDGTPLTYTWKIGNTVIGTGAHINHGFSNPGSYDVTVTVTDACGYNNTFTITIIIQKYKIYLPAIRKP